MCVGRTWSYKNVLERSQYTGASREKKKKRVKQKQKTHTAKKGRRETEKNPVSAATKKKKDQRGMAEKKVVFHRRFERSGGERRDRSNTYFT